MTRFTILFLAGLSTLMVPCVSLALETTTNVPRIGCELPVYDFGKAASTQQVGHVFVLQNQGPVPLEISKVWTGCGCTKEKLATNSILPGCTTDLGVVLDLKLRSGPQKKSIYVHSNDPSRPVFELRMVGESIPVPGDSPVSQPVKVEVNEKKEEIEMYPKYLNFGRLHEDDGATTSIEIQNNGKAGLGIVGVECSPAYVRATVEKMEQGGKYKITVNLKPPLQAGALNGVVTIKTDSTNHPLVKVPVSGEVLGDLVVIPSEIVLVTGGSATNAITRYVRIESRKQKQFNVRAVDVSAAGVRADFTDQGSEKGYLIKVEVLRVDNGLNGKALRIETDAYSGREVLVPIRVVSKAGTL